MDNVVTVVSPGIVIAGSVSGKGPVTVSGRVEGRITVDSDVQVTQKARLTADITADTVAVSGTVKGDVKAATSVILAAGAQVEGAVDAKRVEIDPQARLKGRLVMPITLPRGVKAPQVRSSSDW